MNKYSSEQQWKEILGAEFPENKVIDNRIEEVYAKLRKDSKKAGRKKRRVWKRVVIAAGGAAAAFIMMIMFCAMNPVLAREIPILGNIFEKVADVFSFGKLPDEETKVFPVGEDEAPGKDRGREGAEEENGYSQKDGDVTVTLTEEYASNQAVYIGVCVETEKVFPEMMVFADGTQHLQAETVERYSFREDSATGLRMIEGKFEDEHTFIGIMRIDYSDINVDERRYLQMCQEAEEAGMSAPILTDENYLEYLDYYEIPVSFDMSFEITQIIGDLAEPVMPEETKSAEELEQMTDEEWEAYMLSKPHDFFEFPNDYENWYQKGSWKFDVNITQQDDEARVIEINEVNENGIGIKNIELSSVEMTLNTLGSSDTFAVALDADGNKLESGSDNAYVLAIAGHDISKVYIYICDYTEYMDELKGYAYNAGNDGKSFREVLEERALFRTEVDILTD